MPSTLLPSTSPRRQRVRETAATYGNLPMFVEGKPTGTLRFQATPQLLLLEPRPAAGVLVGRFGHSTLSPVDNYDLPLHCCSHLPMDSDAECW